MTEDELYDGDPLTLIRHRLTKAQYCQDWMYAGIRHLIRNCDVECQVHVDNPEECETPGRYDGDLIVHALRDGLRLLTIIDEMVKDESCAENFRKYLEGN